MTKRSRKYSQRRNKPSRLICAMIAAVVVLVLLIVFMLFHIPKAKPAAELSAPVQTTAVQTTAATQPSTVPETTVAETTVPVVTEPTIPEAVLSLREQQIQNPDLIGWINIEGTKLDYPVMYTPNEEDKYLHADFDGNWSIGGLPYLEEGCSLEPESDNLIIYGHNMANGTMFHTLMRYDQKNFWEAHPTITFTTMDEVRTYEIVSALYDRVYYKYEDCFKFYQFIDAEDEAHFDEAITYFKDSALYDTGVTAEYGDSLITLVTCAYHVDNGRFVVVAKDVTQRS